MRQDDLAQDIAVIIDAHIGCVHLQDVGPLFGQLAVLACEISHDIATRNRYQVALSAALAFDAEEPRHANVVWTRLVARIQQRPPENTQQLTTKQRAQNGRRRPKHHDVR